MIAIGTNLLIATHRRIPHRPLFPQADATKSDLGDEGNAPHGFRQARRR
jgi:hypothetical protein